MTPEEIELLAVNLHNPKLGDRVGNVLLVWEDGEISETKSGALLWQRTLHKIESGVSWDTGITLPERLTYGSSQSEHSFAMVPNMAVARQLRTAIVSVCRS